MLRMDRDGYLLLQHKPWRLVVNALQSAIMRILCTSAQLPGHLDWGGYLQTAIELQRRGHEVLWATGRAVAPFLENAGLPAHFLTETGWRWPPPPPLEPPPDIAPEELRRQRALRALDQWFDEERVTKATTELIALGHSFRPNLIVSEVFLSAAGLAAEALAIPFVIVGWPAMQPKTTGGHQDIVNEARQRLAIACATFWIDRRQLDNDRTAGATIAFPTYYLLESQLVSGR